MDDFTRVKEAVDLVEVVARYVQLKRAGARMVGLCPFHAEKSPSFGIQIGQKFFKCFGCGKGGDVFTFLAEVERIDKVEALKRLAEEAGIPLAGGSFAGRDQKERLLRVLADAQELYRRALQSPVGVAATELIARRRLVAATGEAFGLGYAPSSIGSAGNRGVIANRLLKSGHRREEVIAAGIAVEYEEPNNGDLVDAMRERITIPIRDERGRVIAFGGRRLDDGPDAPKAKYINGRETLLFSKSRVLFGLDRARPVILKEERAVVVEGYLDVILAHQGGLDSAIAALGTSVTSEHAKYLARLAPRIVLFLDRDDAGQRAAERAVPLLLAERLEVRVLVLTETQGDKDPGDYFARGSTRADFEELLKREGVGGLDFLLGRAGLKGARTIEERIRVARKVGEALAGVTDPLARGAAVAHLARELDLPAQDLDSALGLKPGRRAFGSLMRPATPVPTTAPDGKVPPDGTPAGSIAPAQVLAEEELLIALLLAPSLRLVAGSLIPEGSIADPVRARLFKVLAGGPSTLPGEAGASLVGEVPAALPPLINSVEELLQRLAGEPEAQQTLEDLVHRHVRADPGKLFDGAVHWFQRRLRQRQGDEIREGFRQRLSSGDPEAGLEFLRHYQSFRKGSGTT